MAQRDVKKKRSAMSVASMTATNPPSPSLSAVCGSTAVPKLKLNGSPTASSSLMLNNNGKVTPATIHSTKPGQTQMKLPRDEEDLTQSRWFIRSWPRKSTAVTRVAPEHIRRESLPPISTAPETTTLGAQSSASESEEAPSTSEPTVAVSTTLAKVTSGATETPNSLQPTEQPSVPIEQPSITEADNPRELNCENGAPATAQGWIGWLWYGSQQPASANTPAQASVPSSTNAEPTQTMKAPTEEPTTAATIPTTTITMATTTDAEPTSSVGAEDTPKSPIPAQTSWFGFWGGQRIAEPTTGAPDTKHAAVEQSQIDGTAPVPHNEIAVTDEDAIQQAPTPSTKAAQEPLQLSKLKEVEVSKTPVATSSGWRFWYRSGGNSSTTSIADTVTGASKEVTTEPPLLSNPHKALEDHTQALASSSQPSPNGAKSTALASIPALKENKSGKEKTSTLTPVVPKAPPPSPTPSSPAVNKLQRICPPNHVFPSFDSCYDLLENPSFFCKLTKLFKTPPQVSKKHLYREHSPRKVKKAVAIGVHGFFPMRLVRTVLGEPTGTSVRFAESAAAAIKRWAEHNGVEVEVETVALEGEGKVGERVDVLWKLLEKWVNHVKSADFVMIAAHSQGVVVGLQLLARMIEQGWVDDARVGVAAMAGINLGPFYHLPTSILTGSAKELFEFQRLESTVSKKYVQALRTVLAHDVRIVFIGSIDDQLVPLESSTFVNIHHPYIYRAVFVDGRVHAPNFLSHLVGFAMKLRNLGISDHGLIRELSIPLAGSLYGGEGHSRIYDDNAVYDLAVRHALETTNSPNVPLRVDSFELPTSTNNPFFLPWSMRGLLEEPFVRERLEGEKRELLQQFEDWKPATKVLKDVKFRLEGIRSRL